MARMSCDSVLGVGAEGEVEAGQLLAQRGDVLVAILYDAETWPDIEEFGNVKKESSRRFLKVPKFFPGEP